MLVRKHIFCAVFFLFFISCAHKKPQPTPPARPEVKPPPPKEEPALPADEVEPAELGGLGDFSEYFPTKVGEWIARDASLKGMNDIEEVSGGDVEAFSINNYQSAAIVIYENSKSKGEIVSAIMCNMGSAYGAFGLYSYERPEEATFVELGEEGFQGLNEIRFWKGRYYTRLTANENVKDPDAAYKIAREITEKMPYRAEYIEEFDYIPWEEKISRTDRYFPKETMGYEFLNRGISADYKFGRKEKSTIFLSIFPDYKSSQEAFKKFVKRLKTEERPRRLKCSAKEAFVGKDPEKGTILIFRHLNFIGGIIPAPIVKKGKNVVDVIVGRLPER